MIVIPAIDLREGACVQLVGGRYDDERVRIHDPLAVARGWARLGFRRLHVVDLDAATGRGSNAAPIAALLAERTLAVQVGGGLRDREAIVALLARGADRVVVGTRAIEEPAWLAEVAAEFAGRLVVAADVAGRGVMTRGWQRSAGRDVIAVIEELNGLPLAGVLVTAVHREGRMGGTDIRLMGDLAARSRLPLIASGGIRDMNDLRMLSDIGIQAAVVGMALYTGALDPAAVVEEFAS